jgi:hypothetical protein
MRWRWARRTGITVAEAKGKLATAERLAELPATAQALRAGRLSDQQAREIVAGAAADPHAEDMLLATAADDSLHELRNESRRAQAVDDGEGRQKRTHQRRRLRAGVRTDGSFSLSFEGTAEAGSEILAGLAPFADREFKRAKAEGRVESLAAYRADGLVAMARAARAGDGVAAPKSNAKVIVVVDVQALRRGQVQHGKTCEIQGVGPVPVAAARALLGEAALAVVIKDGVDVCNVTHLRRRTNAYQRTALEFGASGATSRVVTAPTSSTCTTPWHGCAAIAPDSTSWRCAASSIIANSTRAGSPPTTRSGPAAGHQPRTNASR